MDTELLKTFLEVEKCRHFGRAGANLHLTQAAVSARVRLLEQQLGTPLFRRYRNNLQLTSAGQRLLPHADAMLIAWERAQQEVALEESHQSTLLIAANSSVWGIGLKRALPQIHQQHPELVIHAKSLSNEITHRRLLERTLDIGIAMEKAKHQELHTEKLGELELRLVASSPGLSSEQCLGSDHIALDWGSAFQIKQAQKDGLPASPAMHTSNPDTALHFLLTVGGNAYLPLVMIEQYLNKQLFIVEDASEIRRKTYAWYHKENPRDELLKEIIKLCANW